jgi:hypothetical protein
MKKLVILLCTSLALLAGSAANAQQGAGPQERVIAPSPVLVVARNPYRMSADELHEFQGQYALENGTTLTVVRKNQRLFATVSGQPEAELMATSPVAFVTKAGSTELTFRQAANGNVFGVQLRPIGESVS